MSEMAQDLRYAIRRLRGTPGFTAAVVLILGLGIGVTTAISSVIDAALLRPLPYPAPNRLVAVNDIQRSEVDLVVSYPELVDWRRDAEVFSEIGGYFRTNYTLTGVGEPETFEAVRRSAVLPRMLGIVPRVGRAFARGEEERSAPRVVMLSERLWQRRFGGDPRVIGRDVTLEGDPYTVIGIIPAAGQRAMVPSQLATAEQVDLWLPLRLNAEVAPRGLHFMSVVGRLRPGLSFEQAEQGIEVLARRLRESKATEHGIRISPLERGVIGDSRPLLVALGRAAGHGG